MANKIFAVFRIVIEYEDYGTDYAHSTIREERFFQYLEDAQHFMWNKYRNAHNDYCDYREARGRCYDTTVEKFDKDKREYEYVDGEERLVRARIEMVEINHFGIRYKEDGTPDLTR